MKTTEKPATIPRVHPPVPFLKLLSERERYSDAEGREAGVYWTIKGKGSPPPAEWRISSIKDSPHCELCIFQFGTLKMLVKRLEENGWHHAGMVNLARVRMSDNGFQVEYFATLADARAAEGEGAPRLGKVTRKHCCPFCMKSDRLRETEWNLGRLDESGFIGPALICERCDVAVPRARMTARGLVESIPSLTSTQGDQEEDAPRSKQ